jgi:hypothetical protein
MSPGCTLKTEEKREDRVSRDTESLSVEPCEWCIVDVTPVKKRGSKKVKGTEIY